MSEGDSIIQTSNKDVLKDEPFFKNMPLGTFSIVVLLLLIQLVRKMLPIDITYSLVISSALVPGRFYEYYSQGANAFATYWPFIGYQFLHSGWFHVCMNCGMLLQAGPIAEISLIKGGNLLNYSGLKEMPSQRANLARATFWFFVYYILCGIGAAVGFMMVNHEPYVLLMGASGAISGVFAGFLIGAYKMVRDGRKILKLLSGSALVFLILNVGGAFVARLSNTIPIAWEAHLFGFLTGLVFYPFFYWMVNLETKTELS